MKFMPRFAFYSDGESIPLRDAIDRVSACMVTPYPPGIPLLVPGQTISKTAIEALNYYRDYHVEIHGIKEGRIKVLTADEEKQLEEYGYRINDYRNLTLLAHFWSRFSD